MSNEAAQNLAVEGDEPVDEARLLHHSYDGIREYDNPLPGWWSFIFICSIVFAVAYGFTTLILHRMESPEEAYAASLADYSANKAVRQAADAKNVSEKIIAVAAKDGEIRAHGAKIFAKFCVTCHTDNGRGLIGANLTDSFQIHGTTRMDIYKTVTNGVQGTPMLAWGEQMPQTDVLAVAAFVTTLRGKNEPNGKAPQGQPVKPFEPIE